MTGDIVKARAMRRVHNTNTTSYDWDSFFQEVTDEIFSDDEWKFNRQELNYIHPSGTFEYTFDNDPTQLSMMKINALRFSISYSLVGGVPIPEKNTTHSLPFTALQTFRNKYPSEQLDGFPLEYTTLHENDGLNGMQIGIYPRPFSDAAVWIDGVFIPVYNITTNHASEIPILPKQFHSLYISGMAYWAALQGDQDKIAKDQRALFDMGIKRLKSYDNRNPKNVMRLHSVSEASPHALGGPYFPSNFPVPYARRRFR